MHWLDQVNEAFPAWRDGEPDDLRNDIADELADHLECAMTRELCGTNDLDAARRNVLKRFGDPQRIARKLWLDAMKGRIMTQRILIVSVVVLALACVGSLVFAWMTFQQFQNTNQAILDKLGTLSAQAPPAAAVSDWATVKFRLTEGTADGKPLVGQQIRVEGYAFNAARDEQLDQQTGANGVATFGPIRPGKYQVWLNLPSGARRHWNFIVFPGQDHREDVVCPRGAMAKAKDVPITFQVDWPEDLREKGLLVGCQFRPFAHSADGANWDADDMSAVVVRPTGDFLLGDRALRQMLTPGRFGFGERTGEQSFPDPLSPERSEWKRQVNWPSWSYRLRNIYVFSLRDTQVGMEPGRFVKMHSLLFRSGYGEEDAPIFHARADGVNHWKIVLPKEALTQIRERLANIEEAEKTTTRPSVRPGRRSLPGAVPPAQPGSGPVGRRRS